MSSPNNSLIERGAEWRATAEAAMVVRILNELAMDNSTKRFVKNRATRLERWTQLHDLAQSQVSGLQALAKQSVVRRTPKPRVTTEVGHVSGGQNIQSVPAGTPGFTPDLTASASKPRVPGTGVPIPSMDVAAAQETA